MTANPKVLSGLIHKLKRLGPLDRNDVERLGELPIQVEYVRRSRRLVQERDQPNRCCLLVEGFAARSKTTATGSRQIVSFHIPGDMLDIQHLLLERADHSITTISNSTVAWIQKVQLLALATERPAIGAALWRDCLIDASIFREWVLNVGRRSAQARIAHMLCEFVIRCEAAGLGDRRSFELPMTQEVIGDATGLTAVHVNRSLQALGNEGAISRNLNHFVINDWDRLCQLADFDSAYLHLAGARSRVLTGKVELHATG